MPERTNGGEQVIRIGAGGDQCQLGDWDQLCDLAREHAAEGYANKGISRLNAVFCDQLSGVVRYTHAGHLRRLIVHRTSGEWKGVVIVELRSGSEAREKEDGHAVRYA